MIKKMLRNRNGPLERTLRKLKKLNNKRKKKLEVG
jgi:hypothetical protein